MLRKNLKFVEEYSKVNEETLFRIENAIASIRSLEKLERCQPELYLKNYNDFNIYFLHVYYDLVILAESMFLWQDYHRKAFYARITTIIVHDFFEKFNSSIQDLLPDLRSNKLEEFEMEYLHIRRELHALARKSKKPIAFVRNKAAAHKDKGERFSNFLEALDTMDWAEIENIANELNSKFHALMILNTKINKRLVSNYEASKQLKTKIE